MISAYLMHYPFIFCSSRQSANSTVCHSSHHHVCADALAGTLLKGFACLMSVCWGYTNQTLSTFSFPLRSTLMESCWDSESDTGSYTMTGCAVSACAQSTVRQQTGPIFQVTEPFQHLLLLLYFILGFSQIAFIVINFCPAFLTISFFTPAPYSIRNLSESTLTQYELDSKLTSVTPSIHPFSEPTRSLSGSQGCPDPVSATVEIWQGPPWTSTINVFINLWGFIN